MKDVCIRPGTYCPVCRGIVGADCWHSAREFHSGSRYLGELLKAKERIAELESIANAAQGEPVAWRINHEPDMGGPVLIKAQPNEHAKARLAHLGVSVTPLYAAPPSDSAQVLVKALEKIARVNAMDYEYQRWAREALAAHKSEAKG